MPSVAIWASPPEARAFLRVGLANRRTLAVGATAASVVSAFFAALASAGASCSVVTLAVFAPRRLLPVSLSDFLVRRFGLG